MVMITTRLPKSRAVKRPGRPRGKRAEIVAVETVFSFVPEELAGKCRELVAKSHAANAHPNLADTLWHSGAREIIDRNRELRQIFKGSSKVRSAKQTNQALLFIATTIVSLEVLARDFAGWGTLFPDAKRKAEETLRPSLLRPRTWLMDTYVYASPAINRDSARALAPSATQNSSNFE
jgi:hypothetical protein